MVPPEHVKQHKQYRDENEELESPPLLLQIDNTVVKPLAIKNLLHCKVS